MSSLRRVKSGTKVTHLQDSTYDQAGNDDETEAMADDGQSDDDKENEDSDTGSDISQTVLDDICKFQQSFADLSRRYQLLSRIGEGTFSTVYKARVLHQDAKRQTLEPAGAGPDSRFVAIKKIYVTSSPYRIINELELLYDLREAPNVSLLIDAIRHDDQVVAILPYYQHDDFREYFRKFTIPDMAHYFLELFTALNAVHDKAIVHRDIKPTNFLYSVAHKRGVLVDFGLAERETTDWHPCNCRLTPSDRRYKTQTSLYASTRAHYRELDQVPPAPHVPKEDVRHSRRANRAGTRGFRAPEVLVKCTMQTCQIDVWSCGIILLTFLSRRFPFFHSADDIDAYIELCSIFGNKRMLDMSLMHGQAMQTNLPTISENGHSWEKIILWSTNRSRVDTVMSADELQAIEFLTACLELNPQKRIDSFRALSHPFLTRAAPKTRSR